MMFHPIIELLKVQKAPGSLKEKYTVNKINMHNSVVTSKLSQSDKFSKAIP